MRAVSKYSREKLVIISFIALLALGFFTSLFNDTRRPSRAVTDAITATFNPASKNLAVNTDQIVEVTLQTDAATKKISGVDITFTASAPVTIVAVGAPVAVGGGGNLNANKFIENITGTQARISYAFLNQDADLPLSVRIPVTIRGTANGTGTLQINQASSQIVGNIAANVYGWNTVATGSYTIGTGGAATATVPPAPTTPPVGGAPSIKVRIQPPQTQKSANETFTVDMIIDGQQTGQRVSGFDVKLKVDPTYLRINNISDPIDNATGGDGNKFTMLRKEFSAATGDITLNYVSILGENELPRNPKVTINMTALANTPGSTAIQVVSSQVTGNITQNAYTTINENGTVTIGTGGGVTPTGVVPTQVTPVPTTPTGSVVINLKLKFQGILRQPPGNANSMKAQVIVGKDGFLSTPSVGTFTADANGIWSGTVAFNDVQPGSDYRIYVKGQKHLQKKVCDQVPTETAAGTYRCPFGKITVNNGQNTYDFSGIYMLVGDLPEQGGAQNGVVDSYDTSYIKLNFGSTDAKTLEIGDLNLDGIVDTQDYALVIAALSIKYDEF